MPATGAIDDSLRSIAAEGIGSADGGPIGRARQLIAEADRQLQLFLHNP
jgi:hypothetical protein